jgi:hypothetical protein
MRIGNHKCTGMSTHGSLAEEIINLPIERTGYAGGLWAGWAAPRNEGVSSALRRNLTGE